MITAQRFVFSCFGFYHPCDWGGGVGVFVAGLSWKLGDFVVVLVERAGSFLSPVMAVILCHGCAGCLVQYFYITNRTRFIAIS